MQLLFWECVHVCAGYGVCVVSWGVEYNRLGGAYMWDELPDVCLCLGVLLCWGCVCVIVRECVCELHGCVSIPCGRL